MAFTACDHSLTQPKHPRCPGSETQQGASRTGATRTSLQAAGHAALPNYTWIGTHRSVLSRVLLALKFLHQVPHLQQGDGRNHQSLRRKTGRKAGKPTRVRSKPHVRDGLSRPGPTARSPASPPAGGSRQSWVAPNYASWVPGPGTPRLRKVTLCLLRPLEFSVLTKLFNNLLLSMEAGVLLSQARVIGDAGFGAEAKCKIKHYYK